MKNTAENIDWEKDAPILTSLKNQNTFRVPKDYFKNLSTHINELIFLETIDDKKQTGFIVPNNYFNELNEHINSTVYLETRITEKTAGFTTPDNYFEKLQSQLNTRVETPTKTRKLLVFSPLSKYSAAASIILLLTGAWFFNNHLETKKIRNTEIATEQLLYDIDESVIVNYMEDTHQANETPSQEELEEYILNNFTTYDISKNL